MSVPMAAEEKNVIDIRVRRRHTSPPPDPLVTETGQDLHILRLRGARLHQKEEASRQGNTSLPLPDALFSSCSLMFPGIPDGRPEQWPIDEAGSRVRFVPLLGTPLFRRSFSRCALRSRVPITCRTVLRGALPPRLYKRSTIRGARQHPPPPGQRLFLLDTNMSVNLSDLILLSFVLAALCLLISVFLLRLRRPPLPPGPRGLPLVGNLFQIPDPSAAPWHAYSAWSREHKSDIISVRAFNTNIVILNSLNAVNDVLDKRSSIYSDRPEMVMFNDLCGFKWTMGGSPYGDAWRDRRKMAHHEFHSSSVPQYRHHQRKSARRLLRDLLQEPDDFSKHVRLWSGATILSVTYDINVENHSNPYFVMSENVSRASIELMAAGCRLVDILPILKYLPDWFPGTGFKHEAKRIREYADRMRDDALDLAIRRMDTGYLGPCAAKSLFEHYGKKRADPGAESADFIIRSTLGSLYIAGAETNIASLETFFLAMVLNPEVQRKAREELDRVVGAHRLPDYRDQASLPYIAAIVQETLRWQPVAPLALPHMVTEDDIYDGHFIPKGSLVVGNAWAILHDESVYPEPSKFNPDRFLYPDGSPNPNVRDPSVAAFGFGRRKCPGRFLAVESLWLAIANILAVYEIGKAIGEDGMEITPAGEYVSGVMCFPKAFACTVRPRSKEHGGLVMELDEEDA